MIILNERNSYDYIYIYIYIYLFNNFQFGEMQPGEMPTPLGDHVFRNMVYNILKIKP